MWADCARSPRRRASAATPASSRSTRVGTCNATECDQHLRRQGRRRRASRPSTSPEAARRPARRSPTTTRTATSRRRPSPTRRSRAGRRSRTASCCSCATGPTSTTWPRRTPPRRSRTSSLSPRCLASAARAPPPSVDTVTAISVYSKYKATALDFLKFIDQTPRSRSSSWRRAPWPQSSVRSTVTQPWSPSTRTCRPCSRPSTNAVPRPVTPFYPAVTQGDPGQLLRSHARARRPPNRRSRTCSAAITAAGRLICVALRCGGRPVTAPHRSPCTVRTGKEATHVDRR